MLIEEQELEEKVFNRIFKRNTNDNTNISHAEKTICDIARSLFVLNIDSLDMESWQDIRLLKQLEEYYCEKAEKIYNFFEDDSLKFLRFLKSLSNKEAVDQFIVAI